MERKYAILSNPVSGNLNIEEKLEVLDFAKKQLNSEIFGLETKSKEEFSDLAQILAKDFDVLVVAGGDGTFADTINAVQKNSALAYLPLGSGNALITATGLSCPGESLYKSVLFGKSYLKKKIDDSVKRICDSEGKSIDLILCNEERKALMASIGLEGHVIDFRDKFKKQGKRGFSAYTRAFFATLSQRDLGFDAIITTNEKIFEENILSLYATKHPFMGYGIKAIPKAKFDDGQVHFNLFRSLPNILWSGFNSIFLDRATGNYDSAEIIAVETQNPQPIQFDGDYIGKSNHLYLRILPKEIKLIF